MLLPPERGHPKNFVFVFPNSFDDMRDQSDLAKYIKEKVGPIGSGWAFFFGSQRRRSHFSLPVLALIFPCLLTLVSSIERLSLHGSPK